MAIPSTSHHLSKSPHTADPALQPFLQPTFDPATYLNNSLPSLSLSPRPPPGNANLPDLSSQTQTLLTQLNAQTARLSNSLTQLTDEIIRSGGRLAYEVEVLRGETTGLTDTLENGLKRDIELLAPASKNIEKDDTKTKQDTATAEPTPNAEQAPEPNPEPTNPEPSYLHSLRTLSTLRQRLDSVIQVFGAATAWPIAPSEVSSGASNFISISGPEATEEARARELKAKEYTESLRREIADLLSTNDAAGLAAASARVEELRVLADVWKGTAEEKARGRVVDGLGKAVEEKQRVVGRKGEGGKKAGGAAVQPERGGDMRYGDLETRGAEGGYGFLQNLRNFKDGMYLD